MISPVLNLYSAQEVITLPIAHGEGRYYADTDTLKALEDKGQVILRYCTAKGEIDRTGNPNGSLNNIAGVTNQQGNVFWHDAPTQKDLQIQF